MQANLHASSHPTRTDKPGRTPDIGKQPDTGKEEDPAQHDDPSKQPGASTRWLKSFPSARPADSDEKTTRHRR